MLPAVGVVVGLIKTTLMQGVPAAMGNCHGVGKDANKHDENKQT